MNSINLDGPANAIRGPKHRISRQLTKHCDPRYNFFSNRIVPMWNKLDNEIVNAKTVNRFKNMFDMDLKSKKKDSCHSGVTNNVDPTSQD